MAARALVPIWPVLTNPGSENDRRARAPSPRRRANPKTLGGLTYPYLSYIARGAKTRAVFLLEVLMDSSLEFLEFGTLLVHAVTVVLLSMYLATACVCMRKCPRELF